MFGFFFTIFLEIFLGREPSINGQFQNTKANTGRPPKLQMQKI